MTGLNMITLPRVDILNINFYDWSGEAVIAGGAERYVRDLAHWLQTKGFEPRLIQNASAPFIRNFESIDVVGIAASPAIEFERLSEGLASATAGAALVIASPVELACRIPAGVPVIGINHGIWWDDPAAPRDEARQSLIDGVRRADVTVCVDTNFINWLRASGNNAGALAYVPNYASLDRFTSQHKSFDGPLRVLFARRLSRERGVVETLQAFEALFARYPDVSLEICGSGGDVDEQMVRDFQSRHEGRVTWTSRTPDDMPSAFAQSHIVIVPSIASEGTSLACIEGMASHNAVVATTVGGLPNLVIDGFNGLLVEPGADALAEGIARLIDDRALLARLAARGVEVSGVFGKAQWQSRWEHAINRVLDGGTGGVPQAYPASARVNPTPLPARASEKLDDAIAGRSAAEAVSKGLQRKLDAHLDSLAQQTARARDAEARVEQLVVAAEQAAREKSALESDAAAADARADAAEERANVAEARAIAAEARANAADAMAANTTAANAVLAEKLRAADVQLADLRARTDEQAERIEYLSRTLASRDEAVTWLRSEVRMRQDRMDRRSASVKLLSADLARVLVNRSGGVKRLVKATVPSRIWNAAKARTYLHGDAVLAPAVDAVLPTPSPAQAPLATSAPFAAPVAAPEVGHRSYDVICLAIIEWTARYQRPHHLMDRFARDGHRVFYVEASRQPPAGDSYSQERVNERIARISLKVDAAQDFYGQAMTEANLAAMSEALDALIADHAIDTAIIVVHLPYWTPLAEWLRAKTGWRIVYDCMDEWADFPNIGVELLNAEERLVASADAVTVTASLLGEKWQDKARRCAVVRNGVDFEFFSSHCRPNGLLADVSHPIIGFYGGLAEWVDFELIAACARARPAWQFVLVGDVFVKDLAGLDTMSNVRLLGRRPYAEMPLFLYNFDVCLLPFKLNDVTHAVDPVKFYEYMSAGKPVVAVPLKEMAIYADYAYFATGKDEFIAGIERALAENDTALWDRRMALAKDNDWNARHRQVVEEVEAIHPMVSIIVVAFNNCALTKLCIDSLLGNATWPRSEIIVVDNASSDETRVYLRYLARSEPSVKVILNSENRGFAAANNQGLAIARGEYLVLLNNDTVVPRGWLEPLMKALRDPLVGLVGPVTNFVGNEAKIDVEYAGLEGMAEFARAWMSAHAGESFDISMLAMFCVAMRRDTFDRVGLLDESFGIGMFEDDDYSRRIQAAGLRTVCTKASFVHHFGQASFKKLIEAGSYDALWRRNRDIYERKWGEWTQHKGPPPAKAPDPVPAQQASTDAQTDAQRVAEYWSRNVAGSNPFGPELYWLAAPGVQDRYMRRAVKGTGHSSWVRYCVAEFLSPPVPRMLSLGCGSGDLERELWDMRAFKSCDAYDIASGAIELAKKQAERLGAPIHYEVRDIQREPLPTARYDAAWFNGSLHHIEELESVLASVRDAIVPGGYLFFNEYVGPRRFDLPKKQREAIQAAFKRLPAKYRTSFVRECRGQLFDVAPMPDPVAVRNADPSEAVRSDDIMKVVESLFDVVARNDCGGTLLQWLLAGFAGHFNESDPEAMGYLDELMRLEDSLIDSGELPSDFVVVVAKPRGGAT